MRRVFILMLLLCAAPAAMGQRVRAAGTIQETPYSGRVVDASTRQAVVAADVSSGNRTARTDANGAFTISLPLNRPTTLTVRRTGYEPLSVTVTAGSPAVIISPAVPAQDITLTPRPPVVVTMTSGEKRQFDADSIEFAYVVPFASPVASETVGLCGSDGVAFQATRSDFRRIVGPAVPVGASACCASPSLRIRAEMKSGSTLELSFVDSCAGYDMNLLGRDRVTAQYVYLKFTEIAEVAFP